MEYIGCFDAVDEVVLEATKQYGSQYVLNRSFYEKLPEVCDCVDKLFEELDCLSIEVNVYDVPEKRVSIEIVCDEVVMQHGREHTFFQTIQMFDSFSFSKSKNGNVCISLNLDTMWERTNE
jgi:hypothetical protein